MRSQKEQSLGRWKIAFGSVQGQDAQKALQEKYSNMYVQLGTNSFLYCVCDKEEPSIDYNDRF